MTDTHTGSIDPAEVARFSAMAAEWWDPTGKFAPLHKFNPVRLDFIRQQIERHFRLEKGQDKPFSGLRVLDIGCGGGLIAEPVARLGADMVAADASPENIKTASVHAQENGVAVDYRATTAEDLAAAGEQFDVILNLEVVEHVAHPRPFLKSCGKMLKPGGLMIVATLNRTPKSLLLAKFGAEYVLRWLPRGTHTWGKFITPQELSRYLESADLAVKGEMGITYSPLSDQFSLSRTDLGVNYMMVAEKPAA